MSKPIFLTEEGLAALEQELEDLKSVKRKEIAEKIKVALSFGDLSENSEYDEAKNEQAIIEGRIAEIEAQLKNVRVLDESELSDGSVHVGSKVDVLNVSTKKAPDDLEGFLRYNYPTLHRFTKEEQEKINNHYPAALSFSTTPKQEL